MVNIYNIRILKLPRGRHDVCESSRVLISHSFFWGGWVKGGGEERRWGGGAKTPAQKKKPRQKKGKEFDRENSTLTLIYQYFG